jgi:carboxylate-amine ligase
MVARRIGVAVDLTTSQPPAADAAVDALSRAFLQEIVSAGIAAERVVVDGAGNAADVDEAGGGLRAWPVAATRTPRGERSTVLLAEDRRWMITRLPGPAWLGRAAPSLVGANRRNTAPWVAERIDPLSLAPLSEIPTWLVRASYGDLAQVEPPTRTRTPHRRRPPRGAASRLRSGGESLDLGAGDALLDRSRFETATPFTVGIEEELMVLDPATLDLAPAAQRALELIGSGDPRFQPELIAAQLEIVTAPSRTVRGAVSQIREARATAAEALRGTLRLAGAGTHPFAAVQGVVTEHPRYQRIVERYRSAATNAVVFGLHVHVAVPGAERAVAVHDALRAYLPLIAALAGNAPFHGGCDSGCASMRPRLSEALPRQGIPPVLGSWEGFERLVRWGQTSGTFTPRELWWEARLHPLHGTVEVRVADAQIRSEHVGAIAALVASLVATLAERHERGELPAPVPTELIAENRWLALRGGLDGTLADLRDGESFRTRDLVRRLIDDVAPAAERLGCRAELADAERLASRNGAELQRARAGEVGLRDMVGWLADEFEA